MRVQPAAINLQLAIDRAPEPIVRNHSAHGAFDEQLRMTRTSERAVSVLWPPTKPEKLM